MVICKPNSVSWIQHHEYGIMETVYIIWVSRSGTGKFSSVQLTRAAKTLYYVNLYQLVTLIHVNYATTAKTF